MAITQSHTIFARVQESSTDALSSTVTVTPIDATDAGGVGDDLVKSFSGDNTQEISPSSNGFASVSAIHVKATGDGTLSINSGDGSWQAIPPSVDFVGGGFFSIAGMNSVPGGQGSLFVVVTGNVSWSVVLVGVAT